jgi:hypothetical protein
MPGRTTAFTLRHLFHIAAVSELSSDLRAQGSYIDANRQEFEHSAGAFNDPALPILRAWLRGHGLLLYRDGVRALVDEMIARRRVTEQAAWQTPLADVAKILAPAKPAAAEQPVEPPKVNRKNRGELNADARKYLYRHRARERDPRTRVTRAELARGIGCGVRIVTDLPVWVALQEKRRAQRTTRGPKPSTLSSQSEEKLMHAGWEKDKMRQRHQEKGQETLARLIAEQAKDKAEDERKSRPARKRG